MIYMNRILLILPVVIVLQGCGVSSPLVGGSYTNTELVDYPEVNIYITAGLGETLVRKGIRQSGSGPGELARSQVKGGHLNPLT